MDKNRQLISNLRLLLLNFRMEVLADSKGMRGALKVVKAGGVIVYPSETSYGIGCDFTNKRAVERIYEIKGRPEDKRFIIIVDSLRTIGTYAAITADTRKLAHAFMPGDLTLVVQTYFGDTIAFRISSHPFAQELCRQLKRPVVSTSANINRTAPIYDIDKIRKLFEKKVDLIVDGGTLPTRPTTTIYDVSGRKVLRKGRISIDDIKQHL